MILIWVGFSPEIASVSPGIVTAGVGENILLACTATGTPPIEYKWLKDGDQIPSKGNLYSQASKALE